MRGRRTHAAAFKMLVQDRLITAQHCFQGLNRWVWDATKGQPGRGEDLTIYSYPIPFSVVYDHASDSVRVTEPPPRGVYMVIVSPSTEEEKHGLGIHGWIEQWNWVLGDSDLVGAPVDPKVRFGRKLW